MIPEINMALDTALVACQPITEKVGEGVLWGTGAYGVSSAGFAMRDGPTIGDELQSSKNVAVGAATAVAATMLSDPEVATTLDTVQQYVGVAGMGGMAGAAVRPFWRALRTSEGITQRFRQRVREGLVRGAVACPAGYGALQAIAHYF